MPVPVAGVVAQSIFAPTDQREWEAHLDKLIHEQRKLLIACTKDAKLAIMEAEEMKIELDAFVKSRGWDYLLSQLNAQSMRSELRGIMRRRRRLVELAHVRKQQADVHERVLKALEEQIEVQLPVGE